MNMMKKKSRLVEKFDPWKLAEIEASALENIEELLDLLGVEYESGHRRMDGSCPVHGGDNPTALNLYLTGQDIVTAGVSAALMSGVITSSSILKRNLMKQFVN